MHISALRLPLAAIALAASTFAAAAYDRHVTIVNNTGLTLYRFYSTNSGASKWGKDVMGTSTLPSGSSMRLNFDNAKGYCNFDFRAVFENGIEDQVGNIDVCSVGTYTYQ